MTKNARQKRKCKRKQRFPDVNVAHAERRRGKLKYVKPYKCRFCGGWHFTSISRKFRYM